jgi:hypothetical protein
MSTTPTSATIMFQNTAARPSNQSSTRTTSGFPQFTRLPTELQLSIFHAAFEEATHPSKDLVHLCMFDEQLQRFTVAHSRDLIHLKSLAQTCHFARKLYSGKFAKSFVPAVYLFRSFEELSNWYDQYYYPKPAREGWWFHRHCVSLDVEICILNGVRHATFYGLTEAVALRQHWRSTPHHSWCRKCAAIFQTTSTQDNVLVIKAPVGDPTGFSIRIKQGHLLNGILHMAWRAHPPWMMYHGWVHSTSVYEAVKAMCEASPSTRSEAPQHLNPRPWPRRMLRYTLVRRLW